MNNKDLPDDLKVSMTQENDKGEVTFVVLESSGKAMLAADYYADVDRWQRGLPLEVRTRAGKAQKDHIRVLDAAIEAVKELVPNDEVATRFSDAIIARVATECNLLEKSVKDMLRRYRETGKL